MGTIVIFMVLPKRQHSLHSWGFVLVCKGALPHAVHRGGRLFNLIRLTSVTMSSHLYCCHVAMHPKIDSCATVFTYIGNTTNRTLMGTFWSPPAAQPAQTRTPLRRWRISVRLGLLLAFCFRCRYWRPKRVPFACSDSSVSQLHSSLLPLFFSKSMPDE